MLGAIFIFFGVVNRLGDGDDFIAVATLDLERKQRKKMID